MYSKFSVRTINLINSFKKILCTKSVTKLLLLFIIVYVIKGMQHRRVWRGTVGCICILKNLQIEFQMDGRFGRYDTVIQIYMYTNISCT